MTSVTDAKTDTENAPPKHAPLARRGLIAAAAAIAATFAVKTDVARAANNPAVFVNNGYSGGYDSNLDAVQGYTTGANNSGLFGRNDSTNGVGVTSVGTNGFGVYGQSTNGTGVFGSSSSRYGVYGYSTDSAGVYGSATGHGSGVVADSATGFGVIGRSAGTASVAAVYADSSNSAAVGVRASARDSVGVSGSSQVSHGVYGSVQPNFVSPNSVAGIFGDSQSGNQFGVYGISNSGYAVYGTSQANHAVYGVSGSAYGVYGVSTQSHGVFGVTSGGNGMAGIYGTAVAANSFAGLFNGPVVVVGSGGSGGATGNAIQASQATDGLHAVVGVTSANSSYAVYAVCTSASSYAGVFQGPVVVQGAFAVTGTKAAAVPHPDGSHRLLYCVESPESWFEDYGEATLTNGSVTVPLDADFAAVADVATSYRVYLTAHGDSNGLYVAARTPTGFTVKEQKGGTSATAFAYRVLARRKDVAAPRLAKVALPAPMQANAVKVAATPSTSMPVMVPAPIVLKPPPPLADPMLPPLSGSPAGAPAAAATPASRATPGGH